MVSGFTCGTVPNLKTLMPAVLGRHPDACWRPAGDYVMQGIGVLLGVKRLPGRRDDILSIAPGMCGASLADEAIRLRGYRRLNARVTAHYLDSRKPALGKACVTAITGRHARNALGARRDVLVAPEHNQPVIHPVDAGIGL